MFGKLVLRWGFRGQRIEPRYFRWAKSKTAAGSHFEEFHISAAAWSWRKSRENDARGVGLYEFIERDYTGWPKK